MTLKSSVMIFQVSVTSAASLTSPASGTSMASTASNAFFPQKLPGPGGWIIPSTKMTNTGPLLWNKSSKILIFTDILYTFCRRLLRPADVTFLKTKNVYQKFIISAFQNYFQTRFYLHISICQSQFIKSSSMWYTLYFLLGQWPRSVAICYEWTPPHSKIYLSFFSYKCQKDSLFCLYIIFVIFGLKGESYCCFVIGFYWLWNSETAKSKPKQKSGPKHLNSHPNFVWHVSYFWIILFWIPFVIKQNN